MRASQPSRQHGHGDDVLNHRPRLARLADGVYLSPQVLGLLLLGARCFGRAAFRVVILFGRDGDDRGGVRLLFGLGQHPGVDVERPRRVAQRVDHRPAAVEHELHPRRRLRAVADGDHDRRRGQARRGPLVALLLPVVAQQVVGVAHQVGQRLFRRGLAVQVVGHFRVAVEVVEARAVGAGVGQGVIADDHPRRLDQPRLDGVGQAEVADDPAEQRFLGAALAAGGERRGREVVGGQDAPRPVQPVETADPFGGLLDLRFGHARQPPLGRDAPGVVGLVVDDQQAGGTGHVAPARRGRRPSSLFEAALVHAALAGHLLVRLPLQVVAVLHQHLALPQPVPQPVGHDAELFVVVARPGQVQHFQPAAHCQAGGHDQHVLRVAPVLGIGDLVEHLPGDQHRHDDRLAAPVAILLQSRRKGPPSPGSGHARPVAGALASQTMGVSMASNWQEEEAQLALFGVVPVGQQAAGDARRAGVAGSPPRLHPRPNLIDQRDFDEHAGVVGLLRPVRGDQVARRAAAVLQPEEAGGRVVLPVARRLRVGGVDDQAVGLWRVPSASPAPRSSDSQCPDRR